jgi:hypothetical protein
LDFIDDVGHGLEIIVDHFHEQVIALNKIGGQARAMVVTGSIQRCIQYFHAIQAYLRERKSPYRAIVAFSGKPEFKGQQVTEAGLNNFPSSQIADKIQEDPYRILVCEQKDDRTEARSRTSWGRPEGIWMSVLVTSSSFLIFTVLLNPVVGFGALVARAQQGSSSGQPAPGPNTSPWSHLGDLGEIREQLRRRLS